MLAGLKSWGWNLAAFVWGVAEGTLFFFVPDVLLSFIGLRRGARAAAFASLCAALGASVGGSIMYLWSVHDPHGVRAIVTAIPAISGAMIARAEYAMGENWFYATVLGPLSSTPYKVYAILAPHAGAPLWLFAIASVIARLPRFLIVSLGVGAIGHWLAPRLSKRAILIVFVIAWVLFYAAFFTLVSGSEAVTYSSAPLQSALLATAPT